LTYTIVGLHPEFTDDVVQTANDRAHMLSKIRQQLSSFHASTYLISCNADAEVAFNDPNTLQNILASLQRLEDSQARMEARLDNAGTVKRNRLQLSNNSGSTIYNARQKQVCVQRLSTKSSFHKIIN
jgi:hypothetical protein